MDKDTAILLLQKARDLINDGWLQHSLKCEDRNGTRYCALGAILEAMGQDLSTPMTPSARRLSSLLAQDEIVRQYGARPQFSIPKFNDAEIRTKASVLAAFDRTIERLERNHEQRNSSANS